MPPVLNPARRALEANRIAYGINVRFSRSVEIARIMALAGYQWLFLDLEHNAMSLETVNQISIAALDCGISAIVRVPPREYALATRALDNAAVGVVMPGIETVDDARELVRRVRYQPFGERGVTSMVPFFDYQNKSIGELTAGLDALSLTVAMIESPAGVANCEAIAAVPGIDAIFVGAADLSYSMGPADADHPEVRAALLRVARAAAGAGKFCGFGGVRSRAGMAELVAAGARLVLAGADINLLAQGARDSLASLRGTLEGAA